jgi:hypothetical protein
VQRTDCSHSFFYICINIQVLLIRRRGWSLAAAFTAFDFDGDGVLSCSELAGGLEYVGVPVGSHACFCK